jgi:flagellar protein FlaG
MDISGINQADKRNTVFSLVGAYRGNGVTARQLPDATPPQVEARQGDAQKVSAPSEIQAMVSSANEIMKSMSVGIEFSFDSDTDKMIVKVIDSETRSILKQFPSEEMIALSKALEKMQAALVKQTA